MGACATSASGVQLVNSRQIDKSLQNENNEEGTKILLIGPGDSGKSTFLKQLVELYDDRNRYSDRPEQFLEVIHSNAVTALQTLIKQSKELAETDGLCTVNKNIQEDVNLVETLAGEGSLDCSRIDEKIATAMNTVWEDAGIQQTFNVHRATFNIFDNAKYFLDKVMVLGSPRYKPSKDDIVHSRLATLGIKEVNFSIGDQKYKIVDAGGQRSERGKWIHCFEGCVAVVFVCSLSSYDQFLFEDASQNCMDEALALFEQVFNSRWFKGADCILFLNKSDLFKEKLSHSPISAHFPDYGGTTYESACDYFVKQFESKCRFEKPLTSHTTCMTDDNTISNLFNEVLKLTLRRSLADSIL